MESSLTGFNAVVNANIFNPSVFREGWLLNRGFLREGELQPGYGFTEQIVHVITPRYVLTVLPQQLSFAPATRETAHDVVANVLVPLLDQLPHTPFSAVGINFVWSMRPLVRSMPEATRSLFRTSNGPVADALDANDAQWGTYASKEVEGARMKVDVKPMLELATGHPLIQVGFNFHCDIVLENGPQQVHDALLRWRSHDELAERIAQTIAGAEP